MSKTRKVGFTETVLRDANQSLIATRLPYSKFEPILETMDKAGYYSAEVWGGATFDVCLRYLQEDPWERLRKIRAKMPNTKLQMLLRGQNILGYKHYPDDVVRKFVEYSIKNGIDIIRPDRIDPAFPRGFVIYELLAAYGFKSDVIDALCRALDQQATGRRFYSRTKMACIDRGAIAVAPIADDDPCTCQVAHGAARSYCGNAVLYYEWTDIDAVKDFGVPEHIAQLDADKLQYPLTLRRWQEGDWFIPFGMTGRKKVSDFLIDEKVSLPEKQRQFVLLSGDEIVWVVGRRIDDRYRLTDRTDEVLCITREIL